MGWAVGHDGHRWVGYGVPAECDWPDCTRKIDRGLDYKCEEHVWYESTEEDEIEHTDDGCGFFFCIEHGWRSWQGKAQHDPVFGKGDIREWIMHQLIDPSWARWRIQEPDEVRRQQAFLSHASR